MQDIITATIEERIQNLLPLHDSVNSGNLKNVNITAFSLIEKAKTNDEFVLASAMIYSNVEENLIYKFNLNFQDKKFVIDYEEYLYIADTAKVNDRYLLKRYNHETGLTEWLTPNVLEYDEHGDPLKVEMPPVVRFIKVGLDSSDAKKASDYWTVLNKIRHKSPDNEAYLNRYFAEITMSKKEYLLSALEFFKIHGLYTKE